MRTEEIIGTILGIICAILMLYGFSQLDEEAQDAIMQMMEAMD